MSRPKIIIAYTCPYNFPCDDCDVRSKDGECQYTNEMKIAALLHALKELGVNVPQWQPIETVPKEIKREDGNHKHGQRILAKDCYGNIVIVHWWWYDEEDNNWLDDGGNVFIPTHWMPLPKPPKEAER